MRREKTDMFKKRELQVYGDFEYKHFCSKCSRYEKCHQTDPDCSHSKVIYA